MASKRQKEEAKVRITHFRLIEPAECLYLNRETCLFVRASNDRKRKDRRNRPIQCKSAGMENKGGDVWELIETRGFIKKKTSR
jgi:hypothetical protein